MTLFHTLRFRFHAILVTGLLLAGSCSTGNKKNDPNHIIVGVESGPEYAIAQAAQQVARKKYHLEVELVQFSDYVMPNEALRQGDIDVNVFQNKPYLDVQSRQRGYRFAIVGNTFVYPLAGYSRKIKNLNALSRESTVVIPNDPTNSGRSLLLLQAAGLLRLKAGVGLLPTLNDVVENPRKLRILELDAPQLPRSLDDANVAIAVINNTFAAPVGLVSTRDGLFIERSNSPYVNAIVARQENKHDDRVTKFVRAYQSPEVEAAARLAFKGAAIKGW